MICIPNTRPANLKLKIRLIILAIIIVKFLRVIIQLLQSLGMILDPRVNMGVSRLRMWRAWLIGMITMIMVENTMTHPKASSTLNPLHPTSQILHPTLPKTPKICWTMNKFLLPQKILHKLVKIWIKKMIPLILPNLKGRLMRSSPIAMLVKMILMVEMIKLLFKMENRFVKLKKSRSNK